MQQALQTVDLECWLQVFHPGVHHLEEGEELDYDRTAYNCLHKWSLDWPCLSFGVVKDSLGAPRSCFPHTAFLIAGTQAAPGARNYISVMKLASLTEGEHSKRVCMCRL
jgi:ribosome assembly protein RRB1